MNEYLYAILGGVLIGLASAGMLLTNGKILGISGILGGMLRSRSWDFSWRLSFTVGLIVGGFLIRPLGFSMMSIDTDRTLTLVTIGGLLVGIGTSLGSGCTSGHGVCGVARFSGRSITATIVFILFGVLSVALLNAVGGLI